MLIKQSLRYKKLYLSLKNILFYSYLNIQNWFKMRQTLPFLLLLTLQALYSQSINQRLQQHQEAYPLEKIEAEGEIADSIGGEEIKISYNNGDVTVTRGGEEIAATRLFWFAWKAFRPKTQLY